MIKRLHDGTLDNGVWETVVPFSPHYNDAGAANTVHTFCTFIERECKTACSSMSLDTPPAREKNEQKDKRFPDNSA